MLATQKFDRRRPKMQQTFFRSSTRAAGPALGLGRRKRLRVLATKSGKLSVGTRATAHASALVERESGLLAFVRLGRAFPPALPTLARVRLQRLSSIGNRRNPRPRAENAANFFRSSARASGRPKLYVCECRCGV